MEHDAASIVSQELGRDEKLLWSGQPRQGIRLTLPDVFFIPFSLLWGGFAIFWETMVLTSGAPLFMALFGIPFVVIGLYMIFGRFFVDAFQRSRTYYGVTDQRVIVVSGVFSRTARSIEHSRAENISLTTHRGERGTITFEPNFQAFAMQMARTMPGNSRISLPPFLDDIPDARKVHDLIRELQHLHATPAPSGDATRANAE